MFKKARLKLTGWYLLIIMMISLLFSGIVYQGATAEIGRGLRMQALRFTNRVQLEDNLQPFPRGFDNQVFEDVKKRIALQLGLMNLGILILAGLSAYFLAGKTLKPIEEALDEQKRFTSDASHELRTPLTALKTEIEVALRDKNLNLPDALKLLKSNLEEVNKMQSLSDYLLTLSRYQNTHLKLNFEKVKISEAVEEAVAKVKKQAEQKNIQLIIKGKDGEIEANFISLVELLTILLDNAIKYSHQGGSVTVQTKFDHKNVLIKMIDTGIGIKASDLPYIFNRFYRADISRSKTQVSGYGLGLSIAKSIVDLYHGQIIAESIIGEGSTFTISLLLKSAQKNI